MLATELIPSSADPLFFIMQLPNLTEARQKLLGCALLLVLKTLNFTL